LFYSLGSLVIWLDYLKKFVKREEGIAWRNKAAELD